MDAMAVWILEYRISHPQGSVLAFDAVWPVHELGNRWLVDTLHPGPGVTGGFASDMRASRTGSTRFDPCSSCTWLGYYLLQLHTRPDAGALAQQLCDVVQQECQRLGWQWQGEVHTPSDDELRPLVERYPNAERWALLALFSSVYRPPWERADPKAAPERGGNSGRQGKARRKRRDK
jgi:hypothetical protein